MNKTFDGDIVSVESYLNKFCSMYAERPFFKMRREGDVVAYTFSELHKDVYNIADSLQNLGYTGKHCAILSENCYEYVAAFFGCLLAGVVFVPLNTESNVKTLTSMLAFADVDVLIASKKYEACAKEAVSELPICNDLYIITDDKTEGSKSFFELLSAGEKAKMYYGSFDEKKTAMLCYTSGTSNGKPKCVMMSALNIFCGTKYGIEDELELATKLPYLLYSPLPMYHIAGLICDVCVFIIPLGIEYCTSSNLKDCIHDILFFRPQHLFVVPSILDSIYRLIKADIEMSGQKDTFQKHLEATRNKAIDYYDVPPSIKKHMDCIIPNTVAITCVGAKTSRECITFFHSFGINIRCNYGMTESCTAVTINRADRSNFSDTVGKFCSYIEHKLVDGILYIRGENMMLGYYKNEAATREAISEDGWYNTGDIAEIDADGYVFIKGRANSIVVLSNGDNIDTEALSQIFTKEEAIKEIMFFSDPKHNGESLIALIYPQEGFNAEDVAVAVKRVNATLPRIQRVTRTKLMEKPFERNEMMKIKRYMYKDCID